MAPSIKGSFLFRTVAPAVAALSVLAPVFTSAQTRAEPAKQRTQVALNSAENSTVNVDPPEVAIRKKAFSDMLQRIREDKDVKSGDVFAVIVVKGTSDEVDEPGTPPLTAKDIESIIKGGIVEGYKVPEKAVKFFHTKHYKAATAVGFVVAERFHGLYTVPESATALGAAVQYFDTIQGTKHNRQDDSLGPSSFPQ